MAQGSVPPRSPAARASARQRNVSVSGAANSSEPSFVKSSGSTGASQRSGYDSANWMGMRMSVVPRCAFTLPSEYSTMEWMALCGCTTTLMRS